MRRRDKQRRRMSSGVMAHTVCLHVESTLLCCQGQNQCCNLVKCRYAVIRLERVQFHQVFIWGIGKPQSTSNDVKLSEPRGFQPPRCHHRKFVPLSQPSERFRDCNVDFEVGFSVLTRFFFSRVSPPVLQHLGLIRRSTVLSQCKLCCRWRCIHLGANMCLGENS